MTKISMKELEAMRKKGRVTKYVKVQQERKNLQAWIDSDLYVEFQKYLIETNGKKGEIVEQALLLYLTLSMKGKLDDILNEHIMQDTKTDTK